MVTPAEFAKELYIGLDAERRDLIDSTLAFGGAVLLTFCTDTHELNIDMVFDREALTEEIDEWLKNRRDECYMVAMYPAEEQGDQIRVVFVDILAAHQKYGSAKDIVEKEIPIKINGLNIGEKE